MQDGTMSRAERMDRVRTGMALSVAEKARSKSNGDRAKIENLLVRDIVACVAEIRVAGCNGRLAVRVITFSL
jgi:hypothetical protein